MTPLFPQKGPKLALLGGSKDLLKTLKIALFFGSRFYRESSGILTPKWGQKALKKGTFFPDYLGTFLRKVNISPPVGGV